MVSRPERHSSELRRTWVTARPGIHNRITRWGSATLEMGNGSADRAFVTAPPFPIRFVYPAERSGASPVMICTNSGPVAFRFPWRGHSSV